MVVRNVSNAASLKEEIELRTKLRANTLKFDNMELNQQTIEEIYKDIRSSKQYMKHAQLQNQYKKSGQWAKAALEGKILKEME